MDLNLTLQLENRDLKQKLEGNTSNYDSSLNQSNSFISQEEEEDVDETPQEVGFNYNFPYKFQVNDFFFKFL